MKNENVEKSATCEAIFKSEMVCLQAVEAYDVLVALLETEVALAHDPDDHVKAQDNRRSALSVARHLICRYDKTFPSDTHVGSWEADSSGCYTTR